MATCLIGLGSNLGNRADCLDRASGLIARHAQVHDVLLSSYHRTPPVGGPAGQQDFLNAALRLETSLSPLDVLAWLQQCESHLGRRRTVRWGSRSIDLDLLLYDQITLDLPNLQVPHPRMAFRRFVLEPAAEIAGQMLHPSIGWSVARLAANLNCPVQYTALAGRPGDDRPSLAQAVASTLDARLISDGAGDDCLIAACNAATGRPSDAALEFLRRRASLVGQRAHFVEGQALQDASNPTGGRPSWISDFSLDQTAAIATDCLPAKTAEDYWRCWLAMRSDIIQPTLLVVRGDSLELNAKPTNPAESPTGQQASWTRPPWCEGPVLHLRDTSSQRAVEEVTAAVLAMR